MEAAVRRYVFRDGVDAVLAETQVATFEDYCGVGPASALRLTLQRSSPWSSSCPFPARRYLRCPCDNDYKRRSSGDDDQ